MPSASSPPPSTALSTLLTQLNASYHSFVYPLLPTPLQTLSSTVESLLSYVPSGPTDLVSFAALLVSIYLTLKIAEYIRRTLWGWVMLAIKILFVVFLVQVFFYVQSYGWEKTVRDASWIGGMLWDYVEGVMLSAQQENDTNRRSGSGAWPTGRPKSGNGWSDFVGGRQQAGMGGRKKGRSSWG